jgi:zinc-ribbon domain
VIPKSDMFCPNCGNVTQASQSFCRSCGMELGVISEELSKLYDIPNAGSDYFKKFGVISVGMLIGMVITFLLVILVRKELHLTDNPAYVFFVFLSMFLWTIISILLIDKHLSKKKKPQNEEKTLSPNQVEHWKSGKHLNESTFVPISSVTESTTELIYIKKPTLQTSGDLY